MASLPARNILDGSANPTTSTFKTAMGSLRDFLSGLLGTDGTAASALTALGARGAADDVYMPSGKVVIFEGATDNSFETTVTVADPTADRTLTLPDKTGTLAVLTDIGGRGATGGGTDEVFVENSPIATASYTLTTGRNACLVGPLVVNTGVTITIPTGQRMVIL